jgi:hypothetical protein
MLYKKFGHILRGKNFRRGGAVMEEPPPYSQSGYGDETYPQGYNTSSAGPYGEEAPTIPLLKEDMPPVYEQAPEPMPVMEPVIEAPVAVMEQVTPSGLVVEEYVMPAAAVPIAAGGIFGSPNLITPAVPSTFYTSQPPITYASAMASPYAAATVLQPQTTSYQIAPQTMLGPTTASMTAAQPVTYAPYGAYGAATTTSMRIG